MAVKTKRHGNLFISVLTLFALSGCGTTGFLFGDSFRYSISGKAQSSSNDGGKGIQNVIVVVDCAGLEKSVYQNRKGITDENGDYELIGYWGLEGCKISFIHEKYDPLTVDIVRSHFLKREGLVLIYKGNASLEPKRSMGQ